MKLTSFNSCSISASTDSSSEDSSSESLSSSLEADDCVDLSLAEGSDFILDAVFASPIEGPDFRGRARAFL